MVLMDSRLGAEAANLLAQDIRNEPEGSAYRAALLLPIAYSGGELDAVLNSVHGRLYRPFKVSEVLHCVLGLATGIAESYLPSLDQSSGSTELFQAEKEPDASGEGLRILVAEDHETNRRLAMLMLERLGYRADFVFDGREAVEAVRQVPYDVVLMDCQMPELDGYEATRIIRKEEASLPPAQSRHLHIIAMTANAMAGDREKCLDAGMDGYISKPISLERVEQVLVRLSRTPPSAHAEDHPRTSQMRSIPW
jgi:CheY-like chemotaxis protein